MMEGEWVCLKENSEFTFKVALSEKALHLLIESKLEHISLEMDVRNENMKPDLK